MAEIVQTRSLEEVVLQKDSLNLNNSFNRVHES